MSGAKGLSPVGAGAPAPIIRPQLPKLQELSAIRGRALRIQLNNHFGSLSMARRGLAEVVFGKNVEEARLGREILSKIMPDNLTGLIAANSRARDRAILDIAEKKLDLQGDARESALDILGVMATRRALRESAEKALSALKIEAKPAEVELTNGVAIALGTLADEFIRISDQMSKAVLAWSELKTSIEIFRSETEIEREKVADVLKDLSGREMLEVYDRQTEEIDLRLGDITTISVDFLSAVENLKSAIQNRGAGEIRISEYGTEIASILPRSLDQHFSAVETNLLEAIGFMNSLAKRWASENTKVVIDHLAKIDKAAEVLKTLNIDAENTARLQARDRALEKLNAERSKILSEINQVDKKMNEIIAARDKIGQEASELRKSAHDTQRMSIEELDVKDLEPPVEEVPQGLNWEKLAQMISNGMPVEKEQAEAESAALITFLTDFVIELAPVMPEVAEKITALIGRIKAENLALYKHALRRDILDKLFEQVGSNEEAQKAYQILDRLIVGKRTSLPPPPPAAPAVDEEAVTRPKIDLPRWSQIPDEAPLPQPPDVPVLIPISGPTDLKKKIDTVQDERSLLGNVKDYFAEQKNIGRELAEALLNSVFSITYDPNLPEGTVRQAIDLAIRKTLFELRQAGNKEAEQFEESYLLGDA